MSDRDKEASAIVWLFVVLLCALFGALAVDLADAWGLLR